MRLNESDLLDLLCQSHITFSVADYLFLDQEEISSFRPLYWLSEGYCVTSPRLLDIYGRMSDYPKPSALILDGVDRARFHPAAPAERESSSIKIGWIGRSSGDEGATGLRMIIHPSVQILAPGRHQCGIARRRRDRAWARARGDCGALSRDGYLRLGRETRRMRAERCSRRWRAVFRSYRRGQALLHMFLGPSSRSSSFTARRRRSPRRCADFAWTSS